MAHEVGHNFSLFHTHGTGTQELVNQTNCSTAGDYLCDTPAEPYNNGNGISGYVFNGSCEYFGTFKDANNQLFTPDTHNFMGYSVASCRIHFSPLQIQKINQTLVTSMSYLINTLVPLANKIEGNIITNVPTIRSSTLTVVGVTTVNSGTSVNLLNGNSYDIKTNQERFPSYSTYGNIKHNNWNAQAPQFKLSENYTVEGTTSPFRDANFQGMKYSLIEGKAENSLTLGAFQFQDPWYIKSDGTQPGNYWITCNATYEPNGKEGASEKGVFLNQNYTDPNKPYYSVKRAEQIQDIALTQTGKTHRFHFQNWSANPIGSVNFQTFTNLETPLVFLQSGATVSANIKGTQLSGSSTGFSNSSQRKIVTTFYPDYYYHLVYSSSGSVWYEKALINSETITPVNWQLMNGAKPLNGEINYSEAKSPSIDFVYATHSPTEVNYYLYIVYQKKKSDDKYEIRLSKFNQSGTKIFDTQVFSSSYTNYTSIDCMPVVGVSRQNNDGAPIKIVVLWKRPAEGSSTAGLYYVAGFDQGTSINWTDSYPTPNKISTTDASSTNPTMAAFKNPYGNIYFHLGYQQGISQIKYVPIIFGVKGTGNGGTPTIISTGSGSTTNISPSITVNNTNWTIYPPLESAYDSPKIVWCTGADGMGVYRYRTNMLTNWSPLYIYIENDDVQSPTISGPKYHPTGFDDVFQFGWSWLVGYYKSYVATNNLSQKNSLPYHGKDFQLSNSMEGWDGFGYCVLDNVSRTTTPFTFENKWVTPVLEKSGLAKFHSGRAGTIIKNNAEFYFAFGDIKLNNNVIEFAALNDSITISTLGDLNTNLITNSFEVNDNSLLTYSVFYGLNDSLLAFNSLSSSNAINFKIEIIDELTQQILNVYDNVTQSKLDLKTYENLSYQIAMQGIGNREIRLRLRVTNNFISDYSLSNIYSFGQTLGKGNLNVLNWNGNEIVKEYALEQNYPNPFNPSTTIRYQIPQDGIVTLKIYDILGSEVATLVNEQKAAGKYEVNFNASSLASGVYIYKIQAGSFTNSKKMLLIK